MSKTPAEIRPTVAPLFPAMASISYGRSYLLLTTIIIGYVGVYLCRKNMSVAVPILQERWGLSKEQVGVIGSLSTVAYALGKITFGPLVDRFGGRTALFSSMVLVAVFGALGALAPGLGALTFLYSANRLAGSASWGGMVKLVPEWFSARQLAFAMGLLSLSFVFGGALAVSFAGLIARWSGDNWHAVLGLPSIVLLAITVGCWLILPRSGAAVNAIAPTSRAKSVRAVQRLAELAHHRQFYIICALSFTLTFMRETFNFWTVDFVKNEGGEQISSSIAAFLSTPFDLVGGLGILWLGWLYDRISPQRRTWLLFGLLLCLSLILYGLPDFFRVGLGLLTLAIGLIGFLVYGPYSLLAGVLAVEVRGRDYAATVAGWVDGIGYLAGVLSGQFFGLLLVRGGYRLGFHFMAVLTVVSAVLCLFLYPKRGTVAARAAELPLPNGEISYPT